MVTLRLYMLQRVTALIMAPLTLGHIGVMIYAVRGGLTAGEVLARTQGSIGWFAFYGLFVVAVAMHAAIGLRTILFEWVRLDGRGLNVVAWGIFLLLLGLGMRAVIGVTWI